MERKEEGRIFSALSTCTVEWDWILEDKEAHFARKYIGLVYFHFKSNEGPLLQRVIKCNKVKYENRHVQRDTRNDAKITCKKCKMRKLIITKSPLLNPTESNRLQLSYTKLKI
eukprot:TRINITY_DN20284_c0_g4_i1.p1 TRINITY_DN20284_c0_g4~~TRINITY_DN20284_c0_g4_i1.p1  ORF type:complete len:113 (+),score=4.80 TRINITY_DN20284_c0_g4_i1:121-459(+)